MTRSFLATVKLYSRFIYPVFMMPALGVVVVGALYAGITNFLNLLVFLLAVFLALFLAHVRDSFIDYYERHEDSATLLSAKEFQQLTRLAGLAYSLCVLFFAFQQNWVLVGIMLAAIIISFLHAPMLDLNPIGATAGYPTGLILALLGGYFVQKSSFNDSILFFAFAVWLVLNGVKIIDDIKDYSWDKSFGKITAVVYLGKQKAKRTGCLLVVAGATLGIMLTDLGFLPLFSALSFFPLYFAAWSSMQRNERDTLYGLDALLVGTYVFMLFQLIGLSLPH